MPSISYQGMKFPDAPGLKMACGERQARLRGRTQAPSARMGNVAATAAPGYARNGYQADWDRYNRRNRQKDAAEAVADGGGVGGISAAHQYTAATSPRTRYALAGALRGDILVHMHCYRADEMLTILDMAKEFGYRVGTFHHGVEAYKIADELAENGVCGALWADWWGFKIEAYDGIQENIALVDRPAGGCAIVHSDSDEGSNASTRKPQRPC
ncbi:MAG: hypothetical protein CM15mP125_3830 [Gammaproteobacteria bacterium]|nr:MAG: hypothetical protein CM15mP125_3830 [Gammaproteobacteria bacterium]